VVQKKLPSINSAHGSETRNIINEIIKAINDRGLEILSESGFLTWLEKNGIKHREEVATFADLPSSDALNTVRGVESDNKIYIKKEKGWVPFQTIDISKINEVEYKLEKKTADKYNLLEFESFSNGNDWTEAIKKAFQTIEKGVLEIPAGNYHISKSIPVKNGVSLIGIQSAYNKSGGITHFTLSPGITAFINEEGVSSRHDMMISNLSFEGDGSQNIFDFNFRGLVTQCHFKNLDIAINNSMAYYAHYINNQFEFCNRAINLEYANGSVIERNRFNGCVYGVHSQNENGGMGGMALTIRNNGANVSDNSRAVFKVSSGLFNIEDNYFEGYGSPPSDSCMIEITFVGRGLLNIKNNYFGSHGRVNTAIKIGLLPAATFNKIDGVVENNYFYRCPVDIEYILDNDFYGIEYKNNTSLAPEEDGGEFRELVFLNKRKNRGYNPIAYSEIPLDTDISGATLKNIDLAGRNILIDTTGSIGNENMANRTGYRARDKGIYRVEVDLTLKTTENNHNIVVIELQKNGVNYKRVNQTLYLTSPTTYENLYFNTLVELNATDVLHLKGRGGEVIHSGTVSIVKIS